MDLNALGQNKLLLQYLAGAGADTTAGNPIGQNVNAVTNQAIIAENFSKMLSKVLGEGGKWTMDKEKFNLTGPSALLQGGTQGMRDVASKQMTGIQSMEPINGGTPNPFLLAL